MATIDKIKTDMTANDKQRAKLEGEIQSRREQSRGLRDEYVALEASLREAEAEERQAKN